MKDIVMTGLGVSILVGGTMITPNFPIVLGSLMALFRDEEGRRPTTTATKRVLQQLEKRKLLYYVRKDDEVFVHLTERGARHVQKYSIRSLMQLKDKKHAWSGKWALVIFDVPELERVKRDTLRNFLLWLGFYPYQKSVYAFPYACEQEVKLLQSIVEGGHYIRYILAEKLDQDAELTAHFKKEGLI